VANATVGLTNSALRDSAREDVVRILVRNVTSLHHLLDDVTSLARLQAGREQRRIESIDVSPFMQNLCEGIRPLAQQRRIFLRCEGPAGLAVEGDEVKILRIAQNLILNAVKVTREGGITVTWGDSDADDAKRWALCISDTGPGFHSGDPLTRALENASDLSKPSDPAQGNPVHAQEKRSMRPEAGEGIGLSIVKRLCEMLDATLEVESAAGEGTRFRILFPRRYSN
jgi:signal transduction histidine kinase